MGNTFACVRHSEVGSPSRRGGSIESRPAALEGEHGTSSIGASVECDGHDVRSGYVKSVVEERIDRSMEHWSELTELESDLDDEEVAQENKQVFEELEWHPRWGHFFKTFGYDTKAWQRSGEMVVGEKFAEGGQAELFHAKVTWRDPKRIDEDLEKGVEWVIKVFKKGTRLRELQSQWPLGYLQWWAYDLERSMLHLPRPIRYRCDVSCGTLLEDGRFAFLIKKEDEDLRSRIDRAMLSARGVQGPFSKDEVERIMYNIALGMDCLHRHNIVHRDLKASNVLVRLKDGFLPTYYVADFECSIGVVGTGFFRAPEILRALEDRVASKDLEVFSKEADVYSYGMTCYEVLTGKLPFEGHSTNDYDLVLNGQRPTLPKYVDKWIKELLNRCWNGDCSKRPSFLEIMETLFTYSKVARKCQLDTQNWEEKHKERVMQQDSHVEND